MQILNPSPVEVIQFMTHNSLESFKKKGSIASISKRMKNNETSKKGKYKKGVVFVSPSKQHLIEGKGHIITSYETLSEQCNKLTHWTPNTFRGGTYYDFGKRIIKGHTKENLKQINVIGFDIDTKLIDLYNLFLSCDEFQLPRPNVLLETPKGFQGFFVLETPFFIHKNHDYKALRVAERLVDNMMKILSKRVPIDTNCTPFGFYRIPNEYNILYFDDKPANTSLLLSWSEQFEKEQNNNSLHVLYPSSNASALDLTSTDWYRTLINCTNIAPGFYGTSRNNALLTLAIANYASGIPFEDAYNELDQWNSYLENPLSVREFNRTLKSAYSGKYKGPKREYVEGLLSNWTNGSVKFQGREGWYKFKKERSERQRSHYEEREEDILVYLEAHTSPENAFLGGSLVKLAETFGMAVSTLKEVLKRTNKLVKRVVGRGRNATTLLASKSMLFRSVLLSRKKYIEQLQLSFAELLPENNRVLSYDDFPDYEDLIMMYLNSLTKGSRAAPTVRLIS